MPTPKSLGDFTITPGFVARGRVAEASQLYATPDELAAMYGCTASEGEIRFAMTLIHQVVGRPSLWPEQIAEELDVPDDRMQVILAARPVIRLIRAAGRYATGRRDRLALNQVNYDSLATTLVFGSPPSWNLIDVDNVSVNTATGEVWLPTGLFLVNYTQVQLVYESGFPTMPDRVIAALIEIINTVRHKNQSDRVQYSVGRVSRTFANEGFVTRTARDLLDPFVVRCLF